MVVVLAHPLCSVPPGGPPDGCSPAALHQYALDTQQLKQERGAWAGVVRAATAAAEARTKVHLGNRG